MLQISYEFLRSVLIADLYIYIWYMCVFFLRDQSKIESVSNLHKNTLYLFVLSAMSLPIKIQVLETKTEEIDSIAIYLCYQLVST